MRPIETEKRRHKSLAQEMIRTCHKIFLQSKTIHLTLHSTKSEGMGLA
jgi:hypothetical protein